MKDYDNVQKRLVTVLRKQLEQVPEDVRARILMAAELAGAGEVEETERHLQMAIALRPNDTNVLYNAACTYGILNKKQEALETLKKAIECGYRNLEWIKQDPIFCCCVTTPNFKHWSTAHNRPAVTRNAYAFWERSVRWGRLFHDRAAGLHSCAAPLRTSQELGVYLGTNVA